jgi:CheY-like chemotaxis protein
MVMKILVVDDESDIRRISCLSLARIGRMEVEEASCGTEALVKARETHPDAVLLDVMMPGLDGPSTFAALRRDPMTAGIPVIFLTAKAMHSELASLRALGARAVLTKPFDPTTLPGQVKEALGHA